MKVIICGAGLVGYNIARYLAMQQVDVTVIDRSAELIRKISESLDVQALQGYASDPELLDRANAAQADMIIAVTQSDEVNMIACQIARTLFNVKTKIARIRNQSYLSPTWADMFGQDKVAVDVVISPEKEVAHAIYRRLTVPGALDVIPFVNDKIRVVGVHVEEDCPIINTPLKQLTELFPELPLTILGIIRDEQLFVPRSGDHMRVDDVVYFAVDSSQTARAISIFGHEEKEAHRIVIVGGGNVSRFLVEDLIDNGKDIDVKIIEYDREQAEKLASEIDSGIVVCGDGLDQEILKEVSVQSADTIVSVTNDDEVNILSALLAKRMGAAHAISLINNPIFSPLMGSLGIDVYVDPKETTVSTIVERVRRGRIHGLHSIRNGEAEIMVAEVYEGCDVVGKTLGDARFPKGAIVGALMRKGEFITPRQDTIFELNDMVLIFSIAQSVSKVEEMFSLRVGHL